MIRSIRFVRINSPFEESSTFLRRMFGDTNCKRRDEGATRAFIDNGNEDLHEDDIPTYVIGNNAPFDRTFASRGRERKTFR